MSGPGELAGDCCVQLEPSHDQVSAVSVSAERLSVTTPLNKIDNCVPGSNAIKPNARLPGVCAGCCCVHAVPSHVQVSSRYVCGQLFNGVGVPQPMPPSIIVWRRTGS